jgi:hypothetical protein
MAIEGRSPSPAGNAKAPHPRPQITSQSVLDKIRIKIKTLKAMLLVRLIPFSIGLSMVLMTACTSQNTAPEASEPAPMAESTESMEQSTPTDQSIPAANLQTYDETANGIPVSAQYPDTIQASGDCAGEGCGIFFTFVPQGNALDTADVYVFLPAGTATAADLEPFVTGADGLIENAGWTVDSTESEGSTEFPYPWVETVIHFSNNTEETGRILLGQTNGQAVQVLIKYPTEMADAYWAEVRPVLDSLAFDANLLPLRISTEGQ